MIKKTEIKNEKVYIAIKTIDVWCNKTFKLIESQKIPKDFPKEFIDSLLKSKIIKRG